MGSEEVVMKRYGFALATALAAGFLLALSAANSTAAPGSSTETSTTRT
jgi:hypothetical protein